MKRHSVTVAQSTPNRIVVVQPAAWSKPIGSRQCPPEVDGQTVQAGRPTPVAPSGAAAAVMNLDSGSMPDVDLDGAHILAKV